MGSLPLCGKNEPPNTLSHTPSSKHLTTESTEECPQKDPVGLDPL